VHALLSRIEHAVLRFAVCVAQPELVQSHLMANLTAFCDVLGQHGNQRQSPQEA